MGHFVSLLLGRRHYPTIAVDAGSSTLWVLRSLILRDLAGHNVPDEIYTNSLIGLGETRNLRLNAEWLTFSGAITAFNSSTVFSLVIIGINR